MDRYPLSVDLTSNKVFELSDESIDYVSGLDKDINVYILATKEDFSNSNQYYKQADTVINKYALYSDHIKVSYIDLYSDRRLRRSVPR